jgi:acetyltransferase-like isoleucine patch superfamily enzyme
MTSAAAWRRQLLVRRNRHVRLEIPPSVHVGPGFTLVAPGEATLTLGDGVRFRHGCVVELIPGARLSIGRGTEFTYFCVVQAGVQVSIGAGCLFANGASVVESRHRFRDPTRPLLEQGLEFRPLTIGDGVWVSSKATVAADVGERAVIAAHAAVVRPIPAWTLAAGVPARPVETFGP